ncbi:uncharacterized protein LOC113517579 isoform X2 [Galleria mellonella]|uniref:Uncharacterized protein LOC113517579 isoform X2 n=1 Tax=Galleria mellonella TaxID=7137 RepID=A0A6J1WRI2_GALME|nr:uncharacterized protein LOC113517579 isoform X2 [Galleria mellonella]
MNLKLNNELRGSVNMLKNTKAPVSSVKEERRRTGRYIAILVGISLFLLAMYHAWVRRIPIVASLVVPALIMFVYVAWVLYTASRDKHRLLVLDAEAALSVPSPEGTENDIQISELSHNNEMPLASTKESIKLNTLDISIQKDWVEPSVPVYKEDNITRREEPRFNMPLILVNGQLPEDLDQRWVNVVETVTNSDKFRWLPPKRRRKRKFCRKKHPVFKRSYSIA